MNYKSEQILGKWCEYSICMEISRAVGELQSCSTVKRHI